MPYETLLCETIGPIMTVTLNRPKVLNALNTQTFNELEAVFTDLAADASIRAILITGAGDKAFAAGTDINELTTLNATEGEAKALRGQQVLRLIETCGKPVVALINGFALGGGCELALACTLRLASENARLGQPEVKLGLIPGYGGTQRLPRLVGPSAALKLILTGAIVDAKEAHRIGLVDEILPANQLLARGHELALSIATMAPLAITASLEAVRRGADLSLDESLVVEAGLFGQLCGTADKTEGTTAFLAKRPPTWTGH